MFKSKLENSYRLLYNYFINGISAEQKKNLLLRCIFAVHEYNIKVVAVTFDGLSTNFMMARLLGTNFNLNG